METRQRTTDEALAVTRRPVTVELFGGPTALIEIGGLRLLTDPTFAPSFDVTVDDAVDPLARTGTLHAVLLSHGRYVDNLGIAGRRLLATVPVTFTTTEAADRLGGTATGLPPWYHLTLDRPDGGCVKVTGIPDQHGSGGGERVTGELVTGPVMGFVLTGPDVPTNYVSGDGAPSLDIARQVADRFGPIEVAVLGAARGSLPDGHPIPTAVRAARIAEILGARTVIPVHPEGGEYAVTGPAAQREFTAISDPGTADAPA